MIIAIDGPAAAGKGTLARRIADAFDFAYLDTGSLYRATAKKVLDKEGHFKDLLEELPALKEFYSKAKPGIYSLKYEPRK